MSTSLSRKNPSGLYDPTAHDALLPIVETEDEIQRRTSALIKAIKSIIHLAGYELEARIELRETQSGRIFR